MANSTTNLDLVSSSQASKEVTVNSLVDAGSPATLYGRRASTTTGLTFGFYGGFLPINGSMTAIANGTVALTASQTNYVEASRATGVVTANTTAHTPGAIPLYTVVCGASTVTSYTDHRITNFPTPGRLSLSVAGSANVTLTRAQAHNDILNFTGLLTGSINIIVPNGPQEWDVFNDTTGAYTLTVKTSAGTGVAITQGKSARVAADGTNVVFAQTDIASIGTGFDTVYLGIAATAANSSQLLGGTWAVPGTIGSTTPNTGAFSTLSTTGSVGIGSASSTANGITIAKNLSGASSQYGIASSITCDSSASFFHGQATTLITPAEVFTVSAAYGQIYNNLSKGAGSVVTSQYAVYINDLTSGVSNFGIRNLVSAGTNKWGYFGSGTANNAFAGNTRFGGTTAPVATVDVTGTIAATATIRPGGYTVGTLPAGTIGMKAYVTDALAPANLVLLAAGGAAYSGAQYDGTQWVGD